MNVTLTGAAGRLGSHVCHTLVEAGHTVRATDRVVRRDLPVRIEVADLRDREACYGLLEDAEAVVHLGNIPGVRGYDDQTVFNENTCVNMNVFQAAAEQGVKRILFASSVQVLAPYSQKEDVPTACLPYLPLDGDMPACPSNAYALSKQAAEVMLEYFTRIAGIGGVAVRFPFLIEDWMFARIKAFPAKWGPSRAEGFAFLHCRDAATLLESLLRAPLTGYRTYFVASRENAQAKSAADVIRQHYAGIPLKKPIEQIDSLVDLSAVERDTDWTPRFSSLR
jgi:nucleoside-diphosphate-sugar epimerase